ncbi:MAG: hypothetical protein LRZ85_03450 [Alphaproteobacteria bacterium]|nr:hypothetical protein [Alphaproteobacteria bacterium]
MDAEWLQAQFRLYPGKSKADLARALGLEPPAVSKILGGGRQIKAQEYLLMRRFFGLPVDGERSLPLHKSGHNTDLTELNDRVFEGDFEQGLHTKGNVSRMPPGNLSEQLRVFRVEEDLMEPEYDKGEHVLVDTTQKSFEDAGVFVVCDGFGYMIRDCSYITDDGDRDTKIRIAARKKNFQPQILKPDEFLVIGRVVGKVVWV